MTAARRQRYVRAVTDLDRLMGKITMGRDGCWIYTGSVNPNGYGQFFLNNPRRNRLAHRVLYELLVGAIPDGMDLDHRCHDPSRCRPGICVHRRCIRPDHLTPSTRRDNLMRGGSSAARYIARTRCDQGHEFTPENTYIRPDRRRVVRQCRTCRSEHREASRVRARLAGRN